MLPLELVNPRFYHLDTCFCPLAPGEAIYFPDAFDAYGRRVLEAHVPKLMPVAEAEALPVRLQRGGGGQDGGSQQPVPASWPRTWPAWGTGPIEVELDEFLKAGGSAKCLTLRIDGEEAASW